ncbi:MAG: tetratricopeptide repeat protein [Gammaproteobacteria bacterium]
MKKKQACKLRLGTAAVLRCCTLCALVSCLCSQAIAQSDTLAEILSIQGSGEFRELETSDWTNANEQQDLDQGNFVRTGNYSRMGILFQDLTQIRLNQNTTLLVKDPEQEPNTLRLEQGRVWTQAKSLTEELIMETAAATAAIRGTDWELEVDLNNTATITVFSGEVDFFNDFGAVTVFAGEQAQAQVGAAPVKLLIVRPADRIQWVSAYAANPLEYIKFTAGNDVSRRAQLIAAAPGSVQAATLLADLSRWDEAEAAFTALQDSGSGSPAVLIGLALSAAYRNELTLATDYLNQLGDGLDQAETELLELSRIGILVLGEQIAAAITRLQQLTNSQATENPAPYLMLADLHIYAGELEQAATVIANGMQQAMDDARLHSMQARVDLLRDQRDGSAAASSTALTLDPDSIESQLIRGDLARIEGLAAEARAAYEAAQQINPDDPRGWHGLGVVNTEREEVREARANLGQALALNANGPGFQGELGVLESFLDNLEAAESAFDRALENNRNDYVSLTGRGILELKRGNIAAALDAFLRAQIMEPHYARAHVYSAIAYYQNGQTEQALQELNRASELDTNDPLPHFMSAIIQGDTFNQGQAVREGQLALEKLPYLKSLNQLLNDQQGSANLGQAYSVFGLSDWAGSYAQQSYYPFWAGSHLFLADQYRGIYTQNSELFQGFLTDPMVFGASNRAQTLIPKPGTHFTLAARHEDSDGQEADAARFSVNGYSNSLRPLSYFLSYTPVDVVVPEGSITGPLINAAVGLRANDKLNLFGFVSVDDSETTVDNVFQQTVDNRIINRVDLGSHYKFSPRSQLWLKLGYSNIDSYNRGTFFDPITVQLGTEQPEFSARWISLFDERWELSLGVDWQQDKTSELVLRNQPFFFDDDQTSNDNRWDRESIDIYLNNRVTIGQRLQLEAGLFYQFHEQQFRNINEFITQVDIGFIPVLTTEEFSFEKLNYRAGLVYSFGHNRQLRLAHQRWLRPVGQNTLGPVATSGIVLDDRLTHKGGEVTRSMAQLEWEWSANTFSKLFYDKRRIENNFFSIRPFTTEESGGIFQLQSRRASRFAREDVLEFTTPPDFVSGDVEMAGVSLNQIVTPRLSLVTRYAYTESRNTASSFASDPFLCFLSPEPARFDKLPLLPRNTATIGSTVALPSRVSLVTQGIYRSKRYATDNNCEPLNSNWSAAADLLVESRDKSWAFRLGFEQGFNRIQPTSYNVELQLRF